MEIVRVSKRLSFVLRHRPDSVGLSLDDAGWVDVDELLAALARDGLRLTRAELDAVVARNDKQRFAFDESGRRIRASQGHSVPVALGYRTTVPPDVLFHGTVQRFLDAILTEGLRPGNRHAVHLSSDVATATTVGGRRGRPVVLRVGAAAMVADGFAFTRSANGVWLTDVVPALRGENRRLSAALATGGWFPLARMVVRGHDRSRTSHERREAGSWP